MKLVITTLVVFISSFGISQTYNGNKKDINAILKNSQNFSKYVVDSNYDMIGESYTENAKIFPKKGNIIEGRKLIIQYWELPKDLKIVHHKIFPNEITIVENVAYDYGYYEGTTKKKNHEEITWKGKYVIIWKKLNDDWKIYLDIWNGI